MRVSIKKLVSIIVALLFMYVPTLIGQTINYPEPAVDQSFIPASPNAQSFQTYGNNPVALYEGLPSVNIPIYELKCGSLSLPISLSYNYSGFFPLQDAGWVGLGWNLNAGGAVSRIVEDGVDSSETGGYNYGQFNLADSLSGGDENNFLQSAYNNNLGYSGNSYDLAPDIFDAEFNGFSGKFFWYNGKAYMLSYDKQFGISWPSVNSNISITTEDGVTYIFGAKETTTANNYGGASSTPITYTSSWLLTRVVSADTKDTINLNYATYSWQQALTPYQTSYTMSTGTQADLGADPVNFQVNPSIQTLILQSITCRNSRVSFIPDAALRTDVLGSYPRLREIDVVDSLTRNTVKKNLFSYEYFNQTASSPASYERLALKTVNSFNPQKSNDSLTYVFKYVHETGSFPLKGTNGVDYWGYYNGHDANSSLLPPANSIYYSPAPPPTANFGIGVNRDPQLTYCSYGVLDTVVYPAGGYTAFQYEQNTYYTGTNNLPGPGICLQSSASYANNSSTAPALQKNYTYLSDNGVSSSGFLINPPNFTGLPFSVSNGSTNSPYSTYKASNNSGGIGGVNPQFSYQKVTESIVSANETHRSDHYYTHFPGLFLDVREIQRIDYINTINTNLFKPVANTVTSYNNNTDTSFNVANPYIMIETVNPLKPTLPATYTYSYIGYTWQANWVYITSQSAEQYDISGDSITTITHFYYDALRNLTCTEQGGSDGQTLVQKFKYPDNYTSAITGNMVAHRVLSPAIESESWLKQNTSDSLLIAGKINVFDQTIFKPTSSYAFETTSAVPALNNETRSGAQYSSILSDSRYIPREQIQYDLNNNVSVLTKSSDISVSLLWDYKHAEPIAEVKNASQADIAYTSFEADGTGNWAFSGTPTADTTSPTGSNCYNAGQTSGAITKSGLTSANSYIVSYWIKSTSPLTVAGTLTGYPVKGKTINGWTYYEHKISGQTGLTISASGTTYIDELRLYPSAAQMTTYTYLPLIGISSQCDPDNKITHYFYDGYGRLSWIKDQDGNITKTIQYHYF